MNLVQHIGHSVWLTDPRIRIEIHIGDTTHFFGCHCCTEQELFDFVRMRVAELLRCGQFDSQLTAVGVTVVCEGATWNLRCTDSDHKCEITNEH